MSKSNLVRAISVDADSFERLLSSSVFGPAGARSTPPWLGAIRVRPRVQGDSHWHAVMESAKKDPRVALTSEYEDAVANLKALMGIRHEPEAEGPLNDPLTSSGPPFPACLGVQLDAYWTLVNEHVAHRLAERGALRILEVGAGFFSLTKVLVSHGFDVTVVEPNRFAELLMTAQGIEVELRNLPFEEADLTGEFDAVVFMESFHHMVSPTAALRKALGLAPLVFLCAEPITDDELILPFLWGPRLDGESYYTVVEHGWNENGFQTAFIRTLIDNFSLDRADHYIDGVHHSSIVALSKQGSTA